MFCYLGVCLVNRLLRVDGLLDTTDPFTMSKTNFDAAPLMR